MAVFPCTLYILRGPTKIPAICFTVDPISAFCASGDSAAQTQKATIRNFSITPGISCDPAAWRR